MGPGGDASCPGSGASGPARSGLVAQERPGRPRALTPHPSPTAHPAGAPTWGCPRSPGLGSANFSLRRIPARSLARSAPLPAPSRVKGVAGPGAGRGPERGARAGVWGWGRGAGASAGRGAGGAAAWALLLLWPRRVGAWTLIPGGRRACVPLLQESHTLEMELINAGWRWGEAPYRSELRASPSYRLFGPSVTLNKVEWESTCSALVGGKAGVGLPFATLAPSPEVVNPSPLPLGHLHEKTSLKRERSCLPFLKFSGWIPNRSRCCFWRAEWIRPVYPD